MTTYFVTNRESNITYLYRPRKPLDPQALFHSASDQIDKFVYYPKKFETMTGAEISKYRKKFTMRFLWWGLRNRDKIIDRSDKQIVLSRIFDINTYVASSIFLSYMAFRVLRRIEAPFLTLVFQDYGFNLNRVRAGGTLLIGGLMTYAAVKHISNMTYLFDIGLKYKEEFAPGELVSENCESFLKDVVENTSQGESSKNLS